MSQQSLWAAPAFPTKILAVVELHPDIGPDHVSVRVTCEMNKGDGGWSREVSWPDGDQDLIGQSLAAVIDRFVLGGIPHDIKRTFEVHHARAGSRVPMT